MASTETSIHQLIKQIEGEHKAGHFFPYIEVVNFPHYRALSPNTKITFDFPLTLLIGQNGTGKTSVLHALYGAPEGYSVGRYWFSTAVDVIDDTDIRSPGTTRIERSSLQGQRSAFWYVYRDKHGGVPFEALKSRIRKANNPDYWEPSRPVQRYGMKLLPQKGRNPQIKKHSIFISLRYELTAFDRCFNFHAISTLSAFNRQQMRSAARPSTRNANYKAGRSKLIKKIHHAATIQDYIRHRARYLRSALSGKEVSVGGNVIAKAPIDISEQALKIAGEVLGKKYIAGKIVEHRAYETWSRSIHLATDVNKYTEAFAGSGEAVVFTLILQIINAPEKSLILLDEPELSLHPAAQRRLMRFLLEQVLEKKLQVVISTHSQELVRDLPRSALKVFRAIPGGITSVEEGLSSVDVFHVIGVEVSADKIVLVEDSLAKMLIECAMDELRCKKPTIAGTLAQYKISYGPGGKSQMFKDIAIYCDSHLKPIFIFDGDVRSNGWKDGYGKVPSEELTRAKMDDIVFDRTGVRVQFPKDSNTSEEILVQQRKSYLQFLRDRCHVLPFNSPEDAIWDSDTCLSWLRTGGYSESEARGHVDQIEALPVKDRYALAAQLINDDYRIDDIHRMFCRSWSQRRATSFDDLVLLVSDVFGIR